MPGSSATTNPVRAGLRFARQQFRIAIEPLHERKRYAAFERDRAARLSKYESESKTAGAYADVVSTLRRDGFATVPGIIDKSLLTRLAAELEAKLDSGADIKKVSRDTVRKAGDQTSAKDMLTPEEIKKGQAYFKTLTNYASVEEPLLTCPTATELSFNDVLIDVAREYLGCMPAMGGLNLRKSFVNGLPAFDTLFFHFDQNSPRFLKFFMYLNDVGMDGGPFCYVRGSHVKKFRGHSKKHRWTVEEIERAYGKENIVYLTANLGDLLIADTSGCHRGVELTKNERRMLTLNYVVHPEFEGRQKPFKLRRSDFDRLSAKQRAVADFLEIVD